MAEYMKTHTMGNGRIISDVLLNRWVTFAKAEPKLQHIKDPRKDILEKGYDPRNTCIDMGLIDKWNKEWK